MVNVNNRRTPAIYALHGGDHIYYYVGSTSKNSDNRLYEHNYRAMTGHTAPVYEWMRDVGIGTVCVHDLAPLLETDDRAAEETRWIAQLLAAGHPLTNQIGRDGIPHSMSPGMKRKLSAQAVGRQTWIAGRQGEDAGWTPERRAAQSAAMKARRSNA